MPKRKGRKLAKVADPETDAKLAALRTLLSKFREQAEEYETYLNAKTEETCEQIVKAYQEKLSSIPEHIRKMTVSEIMKLQETESANGMPSTPEREELRSMFERNKQVTGNKRTQKKDKKRSLSASSASSQRRPPTGKEQPAIRISRTLSESSVFTPLGKRGPLHSFVVTPKFNPKLPVSRMARRPRANEVVMSLSGSPLQCFGNGVSLSLGEGKVLTFDDGSVVDKDFAKQLDEPYKKIMENVKNQLDEILKS